MSTELGADLMVRGSEIFRRSVWVTKDSLRYYYFLCKVTYHPHSGLVIIIFVKVDMLLHRKETDCLCEEPET
jgi:hypothetical protein